MDTTLQGKRIQLIEMTGDPCPIKPNTMGTIKHIDEKNKRSNLMGLMVIPMVMMMPS